LAIAPLEIRIAFDQGYARYKHEPLEIPIPPGVTLITFSPPEPQLVWQFYVWIFGQATPAGYTSKLYFIHWQEGVEKHTDPAVHSLLDYEYPIWANSTKGNPHYIEMHNETGAVQTIDLQLHMAVFPNPSAYLDWYCDLVLLGLRNNISDYMLTVMGTTLESFIRGLKPTLKREV
jgi:hypothetical protein